MNGKMSKCRKFVNHGRSLKIMFNLVIHRYPFFIHFQICSLNFLSLSLSLFPLSLSSCMCVYNKIYLTYTLFYSLLLCLCVLSHFSCAWLFATSWTIAHQALLSMGYSWQEYWSGLPSSNGSSQPRDQI